MDKHMNTNRLDQKTLGGDGKLIMEKFYGIRSVNTI